MKIFITGATGYIGQRLLARLVSGGHEIHLLCRRAPDADVYDNPRIRVFEGDLSDPVKIHEAMHGCAQVYHTAAYARVWARTPKVYFDVNVKGTVNVLECALQNNVDRLVFTSSCGTYGTSNGEPINEDTPRMVGFFNEYESSKFIAEEKVREYALRGLDTVIVHPARVYGPGTWTESNAISMLVRKYVTGEWHLIPGNGKALGCFSYIDDVVDGHILAMEHGVRGEKYILGGDNIDLNTFFSTLRRISQRNYILVKIPLTLIVLYAWQEELAARYLGRAPAVTRQWVRKYDQDAALSSAKAIRELNYRITPFETGLAHTLEWLREECNIYF